MIVMVIIAVDDSNGGDDAITSTTITIRVPAAMQDTSSHTVDRALS